jgi:hypothetical protein
MTSGGSFLEPPAEHVFQKHESRPGRRLCVKLHVVEAA